jgi:hypothetical protein
MGMNLQPRTSGHGDAGIWQNAGQHFASRGAKMRCRYICPIGRPVI